MVEVDACDWSDQASDGWVSEIGHYDLWRFGSFRRASRPQHPLCPSFFRRIPPFLPGLYFRIQIRHRLSRSCSRPNHSRPHRQHCRFPIYLRKNLVHRSPHCFHPDFCLCHPSSRRSGQHLYRPNCSLLDFPSFPHQHQLQHPHQTCCLTHSVCRLHRPLPSSFGGSAGHTFGLQVWADLANLPFSCFRRFSWQGLT